MKIKELTLYTDKLAEQKEFYKTILGFPIHEEGDDAFWVQVGWTKFWFRYSEEPYQYHYCFLIPSNKLEEAMEWVGSKLEIVDADEHGKLVFFDTWNAHSFYFYDAAGNIAECIVRHDLQNHTDKPFKTSDFLCVNEIGLGTDDIAKTNRQLEEQLGTRFWKGDKEVFGTNGSQEGLFILANYSVKDTWFPTDIAVKPNPLNGRIEHENKTCKFGFVGGEVAVS